MDEPTALTANETARILFGAPIRIAGIVVVALIARVLVRRAVNGFVERTLASSLHERLATGPGRLLRDADDAPLAQRRHQRIQTIGSALRSLASFVIAGVAIATILGELDVNLGPLLASAGIVGAALGFGAQSLVRDFLSGAFLIVEDQYGVGDTIDLGPGSVAGTVEAVGLRVTKLRDLEGVIWYVRNGEILRVGNSSQGWSSAVVDVPIASGEDLLRARELITAAATGLADDPAWRERMIEPPELVGIEALSTDLVTLRVQVRCVTGEHLAVSRELRQRIFAALTAERVHTARSAGS